MEFTHRTLDNTAWVGEYTSIAIGTDGNPVISYLDFTNENLKVAKCGNASCTTATRTTVDNTANVGWFTSIAIGTDDNPVISYWDATNGNLKVAKCGNASCTTATLTTVDNTANVGWFTSIAIGTDGNPVISYRDFTNENLKVAKCGNASCTTATLTTVDNTASVGSDTSLAIGADGNPVISYRDSTNANLKVAKCGNASCTAGNTLTTVDNTANVGTRTSIAIGTDGNPVISYYDLTNQNLKVAKCGNASCTTATLTTVDSTASVGAYTGIAIGTDGDPVISYYDATNVNLKVAKCGNASCTTATLTTVDNTANVGLYTSIAIGTDGNPVISYYDGTNGNLKVALQTGDEGFGAVSPAGFALLIGNGAMNDTRLMLAKNGNVGIGTNSPQSALDVGGAVTARALRIGPTTSSNSISFGGDNSRTIGMDRHGGSDASGNQLWMRAGGASVGGTNRDGGALLLDGGISTGSGGSVLQLRTASPGADGTASRFPSAKVTVTGPGDVGIGTTNPTAKLHVIGNFKASGTKDFIQPDPRDPSQQIEYTALEGGEVGVYWRGTAKLSGGQAVVAFPGHFAAVASAQGLSVQLTPRGGWAPLYVDEVTPELLVVKVDPNYTGADIAFDFTVNGLRRHYEDKPVEVPSTSFRPEAFATLEEYQQAMTAHPQTMALLVEGGILFPDGSLNHEFLAGLGWTAGGVDDEEVDEDHSPRFHAEPAEP